MQQALMSRKHLLSINWIYWPWHIMRLVLEWMDNKNLMYSKKVVMLMRYRDLISDVYKDRPQVGAGTNCFGASHLSYPPVLDKAVNHRYIVGSNSNLITFNMMLQIVSGHHCRTFETNWQWRDIDYNALLSIFLNLGTFHRVTGSFVTGDSIMIGYERSISSPSGLFICSCAMQDILKVKKAKVHTNRSSWFPQ